MFKSSLLLCIHNSCSTNKKISVKNDNNYVFRSNFYHSQGISLDYVCRGKFDAELTI